MAVTLPCDDGYTGSLFLRRYFGLRGRWKMERDERDL